METESYLSREQSMARIFETAEREDWSEEQIEFRLRNKLRIKPGALKQIMRVYRAYKEGKITEAQWREVLNAWRDEKETMTGPYNALSCYEAAKEVNKEVLQRCEGISVRWKTDGYDHTVKSVEEYLDLEIGCGAALVAKIEEIYESGRYTFYRSKTLDFLQKWRSPFDSP